MKKGTDFYGGIHYMNRKQKIKETRKRNEERQKEQAFFKYMSEVEQGLAAIVEKLC